MSKLDFYEALKLAKEKLELNRFATPDGVCLIGSATTRLNHSCKPNAFAHLHHAEDGARWFIVGISTKSTNKGEEVRFMYDPDAGHPSLSGRTNGGSSVASVHSLMSHMIV